MTLTEFYWKVYLPTHRAGWAVATPQTYAVAVKRWGEFSTADIGEINSRLLAEWQAWLLPGRSPVTVNNSLRIIRVILNYATDEDVGLLVRVPRAKKLREPHRVPLALTIAEFGKVLLAAAHEKRAPLWRAFLLTGWETGLRVRGLLSLRPVDVLFDSGGLYCQPSGMKNATAQWFALQPETLQAIRAIYSIENELLFAFRIAPRQLQRIMRRILDSCGIYAPHGPSMCFHRLRKSKASYTKLAGGSAMEAMGHSHPSVTAHYLDARICGSATQPRMPLPRF